MNDDQKRANLRRAAYRKALIRLAKAFPQPYSEFRRGVEKANPEFSSWQTTSAARGLLREAYRHRFDELYREEKIAHGYIPAARESRDKAALAEEIVRLYNNGSGQTMKEIRDKLEVGSDFVSQAIKDAGIVPKRGRRKEND